MCTCREPTSNLLYPLHLCGHQLAGGQQMVYDLLWIVHPVGYLVPEVLKDSDWVTATELIHQFHGAPHRGRLLAQGVIQTVHPSPSL